MTQFLPSEVMKWLQILAFKTTAVAGQELIYELIMAQMGSKRLGVVVVSVQLKWDKYKLEIA